MAVDGKNSGGHVLFRCNIKKIQIITSPHTFKNSYLAKKKNSYTVTPPSWGSFEFTPPMAELQPSQSFRCQRTVGEVLPRKEPNQVGTTEGGLLAEKCDWGLQSKKAVKAVCKLKMHSLSVHVSLSFTAQSGILSSANLTDHSL